MPAIWEQKVIANNRERDQAILSPYACPSSAAIRVKPEQEPDLMNIRPAFFHDTDRIIHSPSYSRYIDKTQVFFLFDNDHITHRVLHVQLVSKIARTIGRFLRLNEDLIEAIALGHDIGHTPFGHDGEEYLNRLCRENDIGYFRHNAQSVRFLMELENGGQGCNLTLQVLDGILCHNGEFVSEHYSPTAAKSPEEFLREYRRCWIEQNFDKVLKPFTLEGCVVRVSDVIAYVGRDIEDAITVGLIEREDIPESASQVLGNTNREIIDHLIRDLVENSFERDYLSFSGPALIALRSLLEFNYQKIYYSSIKQQQKAKIEQMFRLMFRSLLEHIEARDQSSRIFTDFLDAMSGDYLNSTPPARIVVDFIAGMTDDYFLNTFKDLFLPQGYGLKLGES